MHASCNDDSVKFLCKIKFDCERSSFYLDNEIIAISIRLASITKRLKWFFGIDFRSLPLAPECVLCI